MELPAGHTAKIQPPLTSDGFIGGAFSMDSLEFLRWASAYFYDDNVSLCVLLFLMGSQEPGGLACVTQAEIAKGISEQMWADLAKRRDQSQVSRSMTKLTKLGLVHMPTRGRYQLQPAATLRGGSATFERPVRQRPGARTVRERAKVDQLDLLADLLADPNVPEAFKMLAGPGPELPRRRREAATPDQKSTGGQ
ncbi:hypothetical protein [Streptomyces goshikiensis]|uniref:hypothetical protein n=1 Tax=Streptomyces goshikiensis TaxID=1942 RepID=UPI003648E5DF